MPLVRRRGVTLSLEDVSQVATAITTHNLRPRHPEGAVRVSRHSAGDTIEVCGPSTAGFELVRGFVQGGVAGGAGVDTCGGHMFVVFAGVGGFGALLAEDAELFWEASVLGTRSRAKR